MVADLFPAYILAGGQSTRFGSDKARALVEGRPLIVRQATALETLGFEVTAVAEIAGKYDDLGVNTIADAEPGLGPLGGLLTALTHRAADGGWVLVTSCDLVELRAHWIAQLLGAMKTEAKVVAYRSDKWQPFPALYHTSLLEELRQRVARKELSCWKLLETTKVVSPGLPADWQAMRGVNTVGELQGNGK